MTLIHTRLPDLLARDADSRLLTFGPSASRAREEALSLLQFYALIMLKELSVDPCLLLALSGPHHGSAVEG